MDGPPTKPPRRQRRPPARGAKAGGVRPAPRLLAPPQPGRYPIVTEAGRLLGDAVREALGALQSRVSVGVLGRAAAGKSLLAAQLVGQAEQRGAAGIAAWVGGGGAVVVDSPPVLATAGCDVRWAPRHAPRRAAGRIRDLQIALLLLLICDPLVVLVAPGPGVDAELARLVAAAAALARGVPGFAPPRAPGSGPAARGCRLHIVARSPGPDRAALARAYEAATNVAVAGVSAVPRRAEPPDAGARPPFLAIAAAWDSDRPLYPLRALKAAAARAVVPAAVLGPARPPAPDFDQCVHALRAELLAPRPAPRVDWAAACVRAWDSIRRSDQLLRVACAPGPWPPEATVPG
ncbi:hypothetical protein H4R18_003155 [Coemansia javaensis]|uniref:Uncharacterized protein n=1 Tax=Coemansia javaensis TaxID=2761396 RepID=A0A9W8HFJ4_9FUNG|nr:hypothetical protein H4R18_003155 [Coemansia javaensis]